MLGQRICELRTALGWSQVQLARIFGVTTDYLLGLEEIPRLGVEGLPQEVVTHLTLLIEDCRRR